TAAVLLHSVRNLLHGTMLHDRTPAKPPVRLKRTSPIFTGCAKIDSAGEKRQPRPRVRGDFRGGRHGKISGVGLLFFYPLCLFAGSGEPPVRVPRVPERAGGAGNRADL